MTSLFLELWKAREIPRLTRTGTSVFPSVQSWVFVAEVQCVKLDREERVDKTVSMLSVQLGRAAWRCNALARQRAAACVRTQSSPAAAHQSLHASTEAELRRDLAIAHRLTALYGLDELVFNHLSTRLPPSAGYSENAFLVTPGNVSFEAIRPEDLVVSDNADSVVNFTGAVIHGAIYTTRPEMNGIVHTHSPPIVAVSCLETGLECLTLDSALFYDQVGYHDFEGASTDMCEQASIARDLPPPKHTLIMRNHAALTTGRSIASAWVRFFFLNRVCKSLLMTYAAGKPIRQPTKEAMMQAAAQFQDDGALAFPPGLHEWPALKKMVERKMPF